MACFGCVAATEAAAQEESQLPRLFARPVAARPLPVDEAPPKLDPSASFAARQNESARGVEAVRRDDSVRRTSLQEGELQWQRRGGSEAPAPMGFSAPRVADAAPVDDPFGDRSSASSVPPEIRPYAPPRGANAAAVSTRARRQEIQNSPFDCDRFFERLAANRLDAIVLNVSPSGSPGAITEAEYREGIAKKIAEAVDLDWTDRTGRVVARGRIIDWMNGQVIVRTIDGGSVSLPFNDLSAGSRLAVTELWEVPADCGLPDSGLTDRLWTCQTYTWTASALCHKPLFFEDVQLERYGQTARPIVQPFRSGAHFFLNIAAMPYNAGVYPPNECRYALGYYRPGDCAPFLSKTLPLSARGALWQAGAVVGTAAIIP